jgi:hypothetical protein
MVPETVAYKYAFLMVSEKWQKKVVGMTLTYGNSQGFARYGSVF